MKSFNLLYESIIKNIVKEGGNAFDDVSRIKKEIIDATIEDFRKLIIIPFFGEDPLDKMFLIGSTGKKADSGDIDIALDSSFLKESILVTLMKLDEKCAETGIRSYINTMNMNMLHVSFPQHEINKNVQIDLLITKNPEFTKFYMFSPTESESRYKGAHRNALLKAILYTISYSPIVIDKKTNEILKWKQYDISDECISSTVKTLLDEAGNRLLYKTTDEPLEKMYAKNEISVPYISNVNDAIKFMIGNKFEESDIDTFEKLFNIILEDENFRYFDRNEEILKKAAEYLKESEKRLEFPEELKNFV